MRKRFANPNLVLVETWDDGISPAAKPILTVEPILTDNLEATAEGQQNPPTSADSNPNTACGAWSNIRFEQIGQNKQAWLLFA
ncbi:unnamed protein product [Urochloa humidicola]